MNTQTATRKLADIILKTTAKNKPETVNELIELVKQAYPASKEEILNEIIKLQNEGKLHLTQPQPRTETFAAYLKTSATLWFWTTILLTIATVAAVFTIPDTDAPLVYIRYVLGTIFILWLPGYTFIQALFPEQLPIKTSSNELDTIERITLSIGLSLALVPIVGLLLNYTPWGIRLTPITLSLTALTIAFAVAAITRQWSIKTKTPDKNVQHPNRIHISNS